MLKSSTVRGFIESKIENTKKNSITMITFSGEQLVVRAKRSNHDELEELAIGVIGSSEFKFPLQDRGVVNWLPWSPDRTRIAFAGLAGNTKKYEHNIPCTI
jgi:hypothetical protein